jgi:hypothetical protein
MDIYLSGQCRDKFAGHIISGIFALDDRIGSNRGGNTLPGYGISKLGHIPGGIDTGYRGHHLPVYHNTPSCLQFSRSYQIQIRDRPGRDHQHIGIDEIAVFKNYPLMTASPQKTAVDNRFGYTGTQPDLDSFRFQGVGNNPGRRFIQLRRKNPGGFID